MKCRQPFELVAALDETTRWRRIRNLFWDLSQKLSGHLDAWYELSRVQVLECHPNSIVMLAPGNSSLPRTPEWVAALRGAVAAVCGDEANLTILREP